MRAAAAAAAASAASAAAAPAAASQPSSLACRMPMRNTRIHSHSSPGGRGCQNPDQDFGTKTWFIFESKNKNSAKLKIHRERQGNEMEFGDGLQMALTDFN
jgi:hypothetical protein